MTSDIASNDSFEHQSPVSKTRKLLLLVVLLGILAYVLYPVLLGGAKAKSQRKVVRFWHMWTGEWQGVVEGIVQDYNKSQDVYEVIPLSVPSSGADAKFLLSAVGGDPPDVMAQWNPVIPTWADNKLLTPYEELMSSEERERFYRDAYPSVRDLGVYKGKLYGITIGMNVNAVYYRPQHFREAGLDPDNFPKTLEELVEVGKKLDKFDKSGNLTRLGFLAQYWRFYISIFGGGLYDGETGQLTLDKPENLRALEFLAAERKRLGYDQVVRFQSGLDTQSMKAGWPFVTGSYSMVVDGQWRVDEIRKFAPDLDYRVAPLPAPAGGPPDAGTCGGNFMIVPSSATNKQGAWDFIRWWSGLNDPVAAAKNYVKGGWLPLMPAITEAPDYQKYLRENPQFKPFVDLMPSKNLQVNPPVAYQTFILDRISKYDDSTMRGTMSPKEAVKIVVQDTNTELARRQKLGYDK